MSGSVGLAVKRSLDVMVSAVALVLLSPLLMVIALLIRLTMGAPLLYRQERLGLGGVPFELVKFRTMRPPSSGEEELFSDGARVTPVGRALRASSFDELPELVHILRGQMSLVGPRPLLPAYLAVLGDRQLIRLSVRPGLTGLAQVSGRQDLKLGARLELDVRYVETWSLLGDLKILLLTVARVLSGRGVRTGQAFEDIDDIGLAPHLSVGDGPTVSPPVGDDEPDPR
jgi:sugar transferase EpsL